MDQIDLAAIWDATRTGGIEGDHGTIDTSDPSEGPEVMGPRVGGRVGTNDPICRGHAGVEFSSSTLAAIAANDLDGVRSRPIDTPAIWAPERTEIDDETG